MDIVGQTGLTEKQNDSKSEGKAQNCVERAPRCRAVGSKRSPDINPGEGKMARKELRDSRAEITQKENLKIEGN